MEKNQGQEHHPPNTVAMMSMLQQVLMSFPFLERI